MDSVRPYSETPMSPEPTLTNYEGPVFYGGYSVESDSPAGLDSARITRERLEVRVPHQLDASGRGVLFFAFEIPESRLDEIQRMNFRVEAPTKELQHNREIRLAVETGGKWFVTTTGSEWPHNIRHDEFQNLTAFSWSPYSPEEGLWLPEDGGESIPLEAPITRMGILIQGEFQAGDVTDLDLSRPTFIHLIIYEVKVSS